MIRKKPAPHSDCGVGTGFPRDKRECVGAQIMLKQKDNAKGAKPTGASFLPQANSLWPARARHPTTPRVTTKASTH
jgi:hypothetical protein